MEYVDPDIHKVKDMDYYLLCTDGLHGYVDEETILKRVNSINDVQYIAKQLINDALIAGGYDNVTVTVIRR